MSEAIAPVEAYTRSRRNNPETSLQAFRAMQGDLSDIQRDVLRAFAVNGVMTDLDLQDLMANQLSTYRTRRCELTQAGFLMDSGERAFQAGSKRVVWAITTEGRIMAGRLGL